MLVVFAMFAFTATPAVAQTSIDPQSLIGEWSGKWSGGTFDGRRLTYGNAELIVEGNHMAGGRAVQDFPRGIKIDLTKEK